MDAGDLCLKIPRKRHGVSLLGSAANAQHSAAQRAHATHARLRQSARTCTCAVRAGVPFLSRVHPRTALLLCLPHGGSSRCLAAPGGSLWPVLGFFLVWWPLAFPCVVESAAVYGCPGSVLLPFLELKVDKGDPTEVEGPIARNIASERSDLSVADGYAGMGRAAVFLSWLIDS